jgi:predicted lipoprotein with Yx(FWY)xxD motif
VPTSRPLALAPIIGAPALAGCGSSSSGNGSTTSNPAASTATASTVATPASTSAPSAAAGVVVTTKPTKLGTIVGAGPKRLTVYLFEADKGTTSSCSGQCAVVWPPVTTTGTPRAGGGAMAAHLGTIRRADGTFQVTYNGHPLYFFARDVSDGDAGDAYGQGVKSFGAGWYVLKPSGEKLDNS